MNKSSHIFSEGKKDNSSSNISDVNIDYLINKVDGENSPKWHGYIENNSNEASPNTFQTPRDGATIEIFMNSNVENKEPKKKHRKHQSMSILTDKVHEDV